MSDERKTVTLETESTLPGVIGGFGLMLPTELSEKSFAEIIAQLEFRRRCMNQGFDNLIELLGMHKELLMRANGGEEKPKQPEPESSPIQK